MEVKAVKKWFMKKNYNPYVSWYEIKKFKFEVLKETEKAVYVQFKEGDNPTCGYCDLWIPKSCIVDEWED